MATMSQLKPTSGNKFNLWLTIGTLNHLTFLGGLFFACAASDFECSGDVMGGIMMVYGLSIFFPQVLLEILTGFKLLKIAIKNESKPNKWLMVTFAVTLALIFILNNKI